MIQERKWMVVNRKSSLRCRDAADERQYMLSGDYEVYEKVGEPVGAVSFHYHDFYELIYIIEGEFSSLIEDRAVRMRKGDFLLIDKNVMHKYHPTEKKMDCFETEDQKYGMAFFLDKNKEKVKEPFKNC
jgi:mannose-6-phosphate isomerase-like protein (cupin superfamily)